MTFRAMVMVLALGAAASVAGAQSQEKCFGVALAGQDQGLASGGQAGSSSVNYQGNAWVMVPSGTCLTMPLPVQPDGTPRRGALEPLDRDTP